MGIISIGELNRISILALYCPWLKLARNFVFQIFGLENPFPLVSVFIDGFSQTFAIFFEIFLLRKAKKEVEEGKIEKKVTLVSDSLLKKSVSESSSIDDLIEKKDDIIFIVKAEPGQETTIKSKFILFFYGGFVISFLRIVGSLSENIMYQTFEKKTEDKNLTYNYTIGMLCLSKLIEFVADSILCKYFLKMEVFRHQLLSLFLITMTTIAIFFISRSYELGFNILLAFGFGIFSITQVMERWIMHNKYVSVFILLFLNGIFMGLLVVILGTTFSLLQSYGIELGFLMNTFKPNEFLVLIKNWKYIICIIISIIISLFLNICIFFITKYLGPTFWSATDYFSYPLIYFVEILTIHKEVIHNGKQFIFILIGYMMLLFSSLIYHEFIILNFYGFDTDSKRSIMQRAKLEENLMAEQYEQLKGKQFPYLDYNDDFSSDAQVILK